jgi:class 3 adenylate cyclase
MEEWQSRNIEPAAMGIGIATGEMTVGEMGCPQRTDYTVIGRAANLGARICGVAKPDQVLISQTTYDLVRDQVAAIPIPGMRFKGVDDEVTVYHVSHILV